MDHFPDTLDLGDARLRPLTTGDRKEVCRQLSDPHTARWLASVAQPFGPADYDELIGYAHEADVHLRAIEAQGHLAGCLCVGATLWFWLEPDHRGMGLMHRALTAALKARFACPASPVVATSHQDNSASRHLLTRLGFALSPVPRRMFFQGVGRSEPCRDYLMAPEQWHLLHPPLVDLDPLRLRPAIQKDAAVFARMRPGQERAPDPDDLSAFIERHRFRGGGSGLFAVLDEHRCCIGMALADGHASLWFLTDEDDARHRTRLLAALAGGLQDLLTP